MRTHPDDLAVDRFAIAMKAKLAAKRGEGRSGWEDPAQCRTADLARMLLEHVQKGDPVDIANFAMMLHQREAQDAEHNPCWIGWAAKEIHNAFVVVIEKIRGLHYAEPNTQNVANLQLLHKNNGRVG